MTIKSKPNPPAEYTAAPATPYKTAGIGSEVVRKRTGKSWDQWTKILNQAGAPSWDHADIVTWLNKKYPQMNGWWVQMVTVGYEQATELRRPHQRTDGYAVSASRTLSASPAKAFRAWHREPERRQWLTPMHFAIGKTSRNKSIRWQWTRPESAGETRFTAKGTNQCQITIDHRKLPSASAVSHMKQVWHVSLGRLEQFLTRLDR